MVHKCTYGRTATAGSTALVNGMYVVREHQHSSSTYCDQMVNMGTPHHHVKSPASQQPTNLHSPQASLCRIAYQCCLCFVLFLCSQPPCTVTTQSCDMHCRKCWTLHCYSLHNVCDDQCHHLHFVISGAGIVTFACYLC